MGYELDRLKNLYGVGTASKALYSGPTAPTSLGSNATAQQIAEYDVAASPYRQGQQAYQNYLAEYDRRLASANPYDQPQFRTPPSTPVNRPPVLTSPDYRSIATRDMATVTGASPGETAGRSSVYGDTLDLGDLGNTNLSQQEQFYLSRLGYQQFPGNADALGNYYNWYAAMNPGTTMTQDLLRQLGGTTGSTTGSTTSGTTGGNTNVLTDAYNKWTGNTTTGSTTGGFTGGNVGGLTGVIGGIISEANGGVGSFTNGGTTGGATTGTTTGETTGKSNVYGESLGLEDLGNPNLSLQNQFDLARMGYEQFPNDPAALTNYYNWYAAMNPGTTMTQDDLRNQQFNIGMPGSYARGGHVRTHYQEAGRVEVPGDNLSGLEDYYRNPANLTLRAVVEGQPEGQAAPASTTRPVSSRSPLEDMLNRYMGVTGEASRELASARQRSQAESEAFYNLIRQQAERGESPTSRSEMYFRLASAFGAPTRTGQMSETLSNVGQQMGEYTRGRRTEEGERRNMLLRAQEARMGAAREDLATTRGLAAQEAQERRALVAKLLEISARDPSERERRIEDIMRTNGVDRTTASNIVNGIVVIRNNPVTGEQEQVNVLTNEVAPLRRAAAPAAPAASGAAAAPAAPAASGAAAAPAAPGAAPSADAGRQPPAQPSRTLWEMAPSVTGIAPAVQEAVQGVTGQVGINTATEGLIRDRQTFATVKSDFIKALSANPRFPVAEMERLEREINIVPAAFTDARSLRERMVSVNNDLRRRLQDQDRAANDRSLPIADRQAALSAANNIRNFLSVLGVPEGADTAQLPSSSRSTQRNRQQAPRVGTVVDGYRFLGGDPSDRSNWSRE